MSRFPGNIIKLPNVTPTQSSASGVWSLRDQIVAQRNNLWPFQRDPYFNYTTLLLQGNVPNTTGPQAMNLPLSYNADASTNNFLVTPNGDVGPRPFSPYFGGNYSVYFDGATSTRLTLASSSDFAFGTGAYTIEAWVYLAAYASNGNVIFDTGNASSSLYFTVGSSGALAIGKQGTGYLITSANSVVALNTWVHVAISRSSTSSNDTRLFVNGVFVAVGTDSNNWTVTTTPTIGGINASGYTTTGYISNLSVLKGTAKYTTNFTPTAQALPTGTTNQVLLACASNRFIDTNTATTAKAITVNGDCRITDNSPFVSTDFTTGAGYFDGTGDYLNAADSEAFNFGNGDFTVEMWTYLTGTSSASAYRMTGQCSSAVFDSDLSFAMMKEDVTDKYLSYVRSGSTNYETRSSLSRISNAWVHIALVRSGGNLNQYINGQLDGQSTTLSTNTINNSTKQLSIGRQGELDAGYFLGNITSYRIVKGVAVYTGNFTPPSLAPLARSGAASAASYPSTTNVNTSFAESATSLLTLQTRSPSQNINFIDSSPNEFIVTKNGNTTQGTFSPFSPTGWGAYFDGTNDYVNNSTLNSTYTGDFTFEAWVYISSFPSNLHFFGQGSETTNRWLFGTTSAGRLFANPYGGSDIFFGSNGDVTAGSWLHIAFVRSGSGTNNITGYVNGQSKGTGTSTATVGNSGGFGIGAGQNGSGPMSGYMSNVRYTAQALYTSNFTPSIAPLTTTSQGASSSNVKVLALQSNRFVDNAPIPNTLTPNNGVSVQAFSPFAPANAVSPLVTGGSGYFDGNDYLNGATNTATAFNLTGDFTIEMWVYCTDIAASPSGGQGFISWSDSSGWNGWQVYHVSGSLKFEFLTGSTGAGSITSSTITNSQWVHIAVVRSGTSTNNINFYVNGTANGSASYNSSQTSASSFIKIGTDRTGTNYLRGYIANLRVVNGAAVYTANFTPPTTPPIAVPNTSLLLNFTNGAAVDATGKNNLESVGNAQNSGVQAKFGSGSIYFNGSSSYLMSAANQAYEFGAGDYTVECWINISAAAANGGIVSKGPVGGATNTIWSIEFNSSNNTLSVYIYNANPSAFIINATTNVKTSTWIHVALTRSGNNTRFFINGTQEGSTYTSGYTISVGDNLYVGGGFYAPTTRTITGYIDDLRITKGIARYTTNFTPPTGPFPIG